MTLIIAWLLLSLSGFVHPAWYILAAAGWLVHLVWHSSATNKLF